MKRIKKTKRLEKTELDQSKEDIIEKKEIIKKNKNRKEYMIIFMLLFVVLLIVVIKYRKVFETKKTYTVVNGYVEKVSDTVGILVKDEKVVETDSTKSIIPIVEQYKRVAKNGVIATYKDNTYDQYLDQIHKLDSTIETLVKDLPNTYSTEISNLNKQIIAVSKEAKNTNSYLKMQEYKNKLDELSYKKVRLLGEYSPSGSKIRELIEEREKIEDASVESSNHIIAPISGAVTYKVDDLEQELTEERLLSYTVKEIEKLFSDYSKSTKNEYGVKIVNNFEAYLIVKTPIEQNTEYIKEGLMYTIKTTEQDLYELEAELIKNIQNGESNYTIFKIENGIENIMDHRTIGLEVVWKKTEGLAVLQSAIHKDEGNDYSYVTLVYGGKYMDIPVKIISSDDNICIVKNYTKEELESLGLTRETELSLYDIIVVK